MPSKLRVVFEKGEALRYTGHLDILRTFIRGMKRAEIPVKYSEGFNPHAVMTFLLPLGVGVTSECDVVDISVKENLPEEEFIEKVNGNMQQGGIKILSACYTDEPSPVIEKADYMIELISKTDIDREEVQKALDSDEILIEKKSKKKNNTINIMEHVFESEILHCNGKRLVLHMVVSAGNNFNIKPTLVTDALASVCDSLDIEAVLPHRRKFYFV